MELKRILTIQDISCVGQCSLTVALPIISSCGVECAILPSAVLSTHTAGFSGFTCHDLSEDLPLISKHWKSANIDFDAIYTGYLASIEQIDMVKDIAVANLKKGGKLIVDPAMADNGSLYGAFDMAFAMKMKELCKEADVILPNITEACLLTGVEYKSEYDENYINLLISKLKDLNVHTIVLTGVGYTPDTTGVVVVEGDDIFYYSHRKVSKGCHGTGDVYSSAFVGAYLNGKTPQQSAQIAADYTLECIEFTRANNPNHWYGVSFEPCLKSLISRLS